MDILQLLPLLNKLFCIINQHGHIIISPRPTLEVRMYSSLQYRGVFRHWGRIFSECTSLPLSVRNPPKFYSRISFIHHRLHFVKCETNKLPNDRFAQHFHLYTAEKRKSFFIHKYSFLDIPVHFARQYADILIVRLCIIQFSDFRK